MSDYKNQEKFEKDTLKLFRIWAPFYDSAPFRVFYFDPVYKKIIETIEKFGNPLIHQNIKFLDVACGTGEVISRLARKYKKVQFEGVDFSNDMLRKAIVKTADVNLQNVKFTKANMKNLPFQDDSFDILLCSAAVHHFIEPEKCLKEMRRVSKKDGFSLIADLAYEGFLKKLFLDLVGIWDKPLKYYSKTELANLLEKSGFKIETSFTYHLTNFFVCRK